MGTQHNSIASSRLRRGRSHFRRLFVWYVLCVLAVTIIITGIVELTVIFLVALSVQNSTLFIHNRPLQGAIMLLLVALPCIILITTTLFFAWQMGRKINQPVDELMLAVEKIRQHDLNFTIHYQGRNELGDLCSAFNALRCELQESLEREWRKQEEMRTMIAALSHDLRTPVTIIQGHIEGLARTEIGEKRNQRMERYLPVLEASSQRMAHLLNDMLLVSSLEQTSFIIRPEEVQLEEEMKRKSHTYTLQAATHEIEFTYIYHNLATQAGPVYIDLHRIEQVLDNLFENALRYTPAHGKINLICARQRHVLSFTIQDTGCGIDPKDLPHVLEKFYHGRSQPGNKARTSTGLGLYICKLFVEKHGGTITVQNRSTGGCEITICISAARVADMQRLHSC